MQTFTPPSPVPTSRKRAFPHTSRRRLPSTHRSPRPRPHCCAAATKVPTPEPGAGSAARLRRRAGTIIVPGKFDAFHLGHLELARVAATLGSPTLLSFSGMAEALKWPPRAAVVAAVDRDQVLRAWSLTVGQPVAWRALPFGEICDQSPEEFLDLLVERFAAKGIVCGADWRFGRRAVGDVDVLRELAPERGLEVRVVDAIDAGDGGGIISSTRVRNALASGEVAEAARLLGRPHRLVGFVTAVEETVVECSEFVNQVPGDGVYEAVVRVIGRTEPFRARITVKRSDGYNPLTPVSNLELPDAVVVRVEDAEHLYCESCEVYLDFIQRVG